MSVLEIVVFITPLDMTLHDFAVPGKTLVVVQYMASA